jgi:hypothetical protein
MSLSGFLRRFAKAEDGNGTVEFVIMLPFFFGLFMSTYELGMAMTRQVMLYRGLDLAVRQVRLGLMDPVDHDTLKAEICDGAAIIPDCLNQVKLEMRQVDPRNWAAIPTDADCVDREDNSAPLVSFTPGVMNQLMFLRACALFDPIFPTSGLGAAIPRESGDAYGLVAISSFVIEPTGS